MMIKEKIESIPAPRSVGAVIKDLNSTKMKVDKNFQRRIVWSSKDRNKYFESVSEGIAVSGIAVADIPTGIEASKNVGDDAGVKNYLKHQDAGYKTVSEDGMNRLNSLETFINNELYFSGKLYDLEHKCHKIDNKKFDDLDESIQWAFLGSNIIVVTIYHAPYSDLSRIFTNLNAGIPLNAMEKRNALSTPISSYIRDKAEGVYPQLWKRYISSQSILRMEDLKWLAKVLVCVNRETKGWELGEGSIDIFYEKGVSKMDLENVKEYNEKELVRLGGIMDILQEASLKQTTIRPSSKLPAKTFWALLFVAEYIYDNSYDIMDYSKLFSFVYLKDNFLERESKAKQSSDQENYRKDHLHLSKEDLEKKLSDEFKDDKYYWRWINRNDDYKLRSQRQENLIKAILCDENVSSYFGKEIPREIEEAA